MSSPRPPRLALLGSRKFRPTPLSRTERAAKRHLRKKRRRMVQDKRTQVLALHAGMPAVESTKHENDSVTKTQGDQSHRRTTPCQWQLAKQESHETSSVPVKRHPLPTSNGLKLLPSIYSRRRARQRRNKSTARDPDLILVSGCSRMLGIVQLILNAPAACTRACWGNTSIRQAQSTLKPNKAQNT